MNVNVQSAIDGVQVLLKRQQANVARESEFAHEGGQGVALSEWIAATTDQVKSGIAAHRFGEGAQQPVVVLDVAIIGDVAQQDGFPGESEFRAEVTHRASEIGDGDSVVEDS